MKLKNKANKGITLVALVITIIILLILAGITIVSLLGENGLLNRSSQAKEEAVKAQLKEEIEMAIMDIQAEELPKGKNVTLESLAGQGEENGQLENHKDLKEGNITANLDEDEITGEYKGYNYKIDKNLNVYIEKTIISQTSKKVRYIIVEINGYLEGCDDAIINELEIYDKDINKCNYIVLSNLEYDTGTKGKSSYWENMSYWNYTNLNDGSYEYSSNAVGGQNCTAFFDGQYKNIDSWARFIIDLGEEKEIGQIRVCVGGNDERNTSMNLSVCNLPKQINLYAIKNFVEGQEDNSTYAKNIIKKNNEDIVLIGSKEFSEIISTPTWIEYFENVGKNYINARYLLTEINGYLENAKYAVINELQVYNIYNEKINYTILKELEYDNTRQGYSANWNKSNNWSSDNINDNSYGYSSNVEGMVNCADFLGGSYNSDDQWVRFIIDLNKKEKIKDIILYVGGNDATSSCGSYTPREVSFFKVNNFVNGKEENSTYNRNINKKNNENIDFIKSIIFEELLFSPKKINLLDTSI